MKKKFLERKMWKNLRWVLASVQPINPCSITTVTTPIIIIIIMVVVAVAVNDIGIIFRGG